MSCFSPSRTVLGYLLATLLHMWPTAPKQNQSTLL